MRLRRIKLPRFASGLALLAIIEKLAFVLLNIEQDARAFGVVREPRRQLRIGDNGTVVIEPINFAGCSVKPQEVVLEPAKTAILEIGQRIVQVRVSKCLLAP